jgi:hypothetical protein
MFIDNRYTKIYESIVSQSMLRGNNKSDHEDYLESHHITPKAMGGSDDPSNLVLLTAREHFLCHLLLTRMTEGKNLIRMRHAFSFMVQCAGNSKWFELARKSASQQRDPEWGRNISKARKGQVPSAEAIAKMRATLTGRKMKPEHRQRLSELAKLRTMTPQCRSARKETLQRTYPIITPDGTEFTVTNLKQWCKDNGFNYHTAHSNTRAPSPVKSGALLGYKFKACI